MPDPGSRLTLGFASGKVKTQLVQLMDRDVLNKVMANYLGKFSISKDIYNNSTWFDKLIIIALARGIRANIMTLGNNGSIVQHIKKPYLSYMLFWI